MNKQLLSGIIILITAMLIPASAFSTQSQEIKAKGYGTIYGGNKTAARDRAIEDAQRKAVEQAMGTLISSETVTENFQLINDRILSLSSGYVEKYRVSSENVVDNEMQVEISALVGIGKLKDSVQAIKSLIRRMDRPKLMVLIAEQSIREEVKQGSGKGDSAGHVVLSATSLGITENALIEFFRKKGFDFVDRQSLAGQIEVSDPLALVNDKARIKKIANLTDAQIVIFGQAQARTADKIHGIYSGQATISLRALKTDTGEIIAATNAHAAVPFVDPSTANTKALAEASKKISFKIMDQILEKWQSESSGLRNISLIIKKVKYSDAKRFRSWLTKHIRGVKEVHQRSVKNQIAQFDIDMKGSAQDLADELSEKKFQEKTIEVLDLSPNKVSIEFK